MLKRKPKKKSLETKSLKAKPKKKKTLNMLGETSAVGSWLEEMIKRHEGKSLLPDIESSPKTNDATNDAEERVLTDFIPGVIRKHSLEPLVSEAKVLTSYANSTLESVTGDVMGAINEINRMIALIMILGVTS